MGNMATKWSLKDNLASKVTAAVFFSIVVIESVILIPSYLNYERDLLIRLEQVGRASIISGLKVQGHVNERDLPVLGKVLSRQGEVVGGSFHRPNGQIIGKFGILPEIKPRKELETSERRRSSDGQWLDVVWPSNLTNLPWTIVARLDARWIGNELQMFLVRMAGLVALISIVVCGTTMLILHFLVLRRIKILCDWLLRVNYDTENPQEAFPVVGPKDELGQMSSTLHDVVELAKSSLSKVRRDRARLDEANHQLEQIIEKRTQEIRTSKEAAEMANRAKTEFLAHMSHELRTPLNAILGFSEVLKSQMFGPLGDNKYIEYVNDIHDSGNHLTNIINDILDVSRVETGDLKIMDEDVDLRKLVEECRIMVQERAKTAQIDLSIQMDPKLPNLCADGRRVKQILLNLISNAIKFTPEKGKVSIHVKLGNDNGIVLQVTDTGIGIPADKIANVLRPFGQVRKAYTSKDEEGVGLGLALVSSLTELHGGTLNIKSAPGKGTSVSVSFPSERVIQGR